MTCSPDCPMRPWLHFHAQTGGALMASTDDDIIPPFTPETAHDLASLVHAARNIADIGVRPVRVWLGTAKCSEHTGTIEDERTLDIAATPTDRLKCALCCVRQWSNPYQATTWRVIRG